MLGAMALHHLALHLAVHFRAALVLALMLVLLPMRLLVLGVLGRAVLRMIDRSRIGSLCRGKRRSCDKDVHLFTPITWIDF
jgi:hypothetical protein